jgi:hypothetical protein
LKAPGINGCPGTSGPGGTGAQEKTGHILASVIFMGSIELQNCKQIAIMLRLNSFFSGDVLFVKASFFSFAPQGSKSGKIWRINYF